ncbi:MAG: hypothetical protein ACO3UU_12175 [Minisyncoccia bacterium]
MSNNHKDRQESKPQTKRPLGDDTPRRPLRESVHIAVPKNEN